MNSALRVQDIFIYPIKSLRGIRVESAKVLERGFQYDRRWMLVDRTGLFLTQRTHPQMALIKVDLREDHLIVSSPLAQDNSLKIPFDLQLDSQIEVEIWDDRLSANLVDPTIDQWFSEILGIDCQLVRMPESGQRKVSPKYAINKEFVSFADGMPYLIIGQESLHHLNSKLTHPVPMNRFRPNIVFSGGESFIEDGWKNIKIGDVDFCIVKPCARCVLITVDQESGVNGKEPLKTLASYRTLNNKVYFGQNALSLQEGYVRIGDSIQLI
ncbi:MAG: MOSC domain-containing protein [Algoriphagus sp.]|uniref:MOSC domain-containing protein n=1 Tax=Algoriphagus sp. TaxID=1872435 RepID=UPI00262EDCF0|nr:MOSC N-terminal beta barrel domain-containing protein [Algoriphagus sp.]MDG1276862.1 MOSC domain-containing protein [Algoriphagus sp.]